MNFLRNFLFVLLFIPFLSCEGLKSSPGIEFLGPILETIDIKGRLEYSGRVVNKSEASVSGALVRYVAENKDGKIIEAVTIPLVGRKGSSILRGEVVSFQLLLRSRADSVFKKRFSLDYKK